MRYLWLFLYSILMVAVFLITPSAAWAATLSLSPSSGALNKGCSYSLGIEVDTQGAQTAGTDAILLYDSSRFTATSITSGTIYQEYPGNNIDETNNKIIVSGLAAVSKPFAGKGTLATINLAVKDAAPSGATQIKFAFDPNDKTNTTDSNVVENGTVQELLSSVVNGNYTIGAGSCGALPGATKVGAPTAESSTPSGAISKPPPFTALPEAGVEEFTYAVVIVGSILVVLGILGLALL